MKRYQSSRESHLPLADEERKQTKVRQPRRVKRAVVVHKTRRHKLLEALADERKQGNSLAKLYVALLARTLIDQEPGLLILEPCTPWMESGEYYLQQCGVRKYEANRHMPKVKTQ